jgi:4-amino-4-deoxy-L-arabinose transferase-like glycosyltransferase
MDYPSSLGATFIHSHKLHTNNFWLWLKENYPLISLLLRSTLFLFTVGPFYNWDTNIEFQAATGVLQWGKPYLNFDNLINQPPIGFYIEAAFFKIFATDPTQQTAVTISTLFGIGCIFLLYKLGQSLYGKSTGLLAAALYALTPWQVVLSRSFLIDSPCLFFSLLYLLVGIWAIRKDSLKIVVLAGLFFGIALLTKAFAVFMLIPLALFYFYFHKIRLQKLAASLFFLPASMFVLLWYQGLSGLGIIKFLLHDDFFTYNDQYFPSIFFVGNYLSTNLGLLFLITVTLSVFLACAQQRLFAKTLRYDLICLLTVLVIAGFNTLLAVGLNLKVPYFSPFKYTFQLLPFLCLLAGSLVSKSRILLASLKSKSSLFLFMLTCLGLAALLVTMYRNMSSILLYSSLDYLLFRVEGTVAYSFNNFVQIAPSSGFIYVQYAGFAIIASGLLWRLWGHLKFR